MKYARRALYAARCENIRWPALGLIQAAQTACCTDARDHVYALLGLIDQLSDMKVDYTKATHEVFEDATLQLMRRTQSLDTLVIGSRSASDPHLPSWVVPFERLGSHNTIDPSVMAVGRFNPSCGAKFRFALPCQGRLDVFGFQIDTIAKAYSGVESWEWSSNTDAVFNAIERRRSAYLLHTGISEASSVSSDRIRTFWRTMLWGDWPDTEDSIVEPKLSLSTISTLADSTFFLTKGGLVGLANGATSVRPGDALYVLAGCGHPMCLRRTAATEQTFEAIAPAYVDGSCPSIFRIATHCLLTHHRHHERRGCHSRGT